MSLLRSSFFRKGLRDLVTNWVNPKNAFWLSSLSWVLYFWDFISKTADSIWDSIAHLVDGGCVSLNPIALLAGKLFQPNGYLHSVWEIILNGLNSDYIHGFTNLFDYLWEVIGISWYINFAANWISLYVTIILSAYAFKGVRWIVSTVLKAIPFT